MEYIFYEGEKIYMQNSIDYLKTNFLIIKGMGWIRSLRQGPTGIGYTFESLLGKSEDSLCVPDFDGIEIKTHRKNSRSYINLFNYNPIGNTSYEVKRIFEKYGYISRKDKTRKVFYCSVYSNYIIDAGLNYKLSLYVDYLERRIYLLVFDRIGRLIEKESYWNFDILEDKLYSKMNVLAYIEAQSKQYNTCEFFKYESIKFYKLKNFDVFIQLVDKGIICVNFKVSGYKNEGLGLIDSHGVSFCIGTNNLGMLYDMIC